MRRSAYRSWIVWGTIGLVLVAGVGLGATILYPLRYEGMITDYSTAQGLDPYLVFGVIRAESRFRARAVSPAGAIGLMQITPATGEWIAGKIGMTGFTPADLYEPESAERKAVVQEVLRTVLSGFLRALHPIMPFITEELWHRLDEKAGPIAVARFPEADQAWFDDEAEAKMAEIQGTVTAIRTLRATLTLPPSQRVPVTIIADDADSYAVLDASTPLVHRYPPRPSGESIVEIIEAIVNDNPKEYYNLYLPVRGAPPVPVPVQVNVPNQGAVPGIPDDVAVEIPVRIDGKGVHRRPVTPLPKKIMDYVILPRLMRAEWAIEAFLEGGRDHLFHWLIVDPRTKSTRQVEEVIDAILKMPGNEEMAKHYS